MSDIAETKAMRDENETPIACKHCGHDFHGGNVCMPKSAPDDPYCACTKGGLPPITAPRGGSRFDGPLMGPAEAAVQRQQLREKLEAARAACYEESSRRYIADAAGEVLYMDAARILRDCLTILAEEEATS